MYCQQCGAAFVSNESFCKECGIVVQEMSRTTYASQKTMYTPMLFLTTVTSVIVLIILLSSNWISVRNSYWGTRVRSEYTFIDLQLRADDVERLFRDEAERFVFNYYRQQYDCPLAGWGLSPEAQEERRQENLAYARVRAQDSINSMWLFINIASLLLLLIPLFHLIAIYKLAVSANRKYGAGKFYAFALMANALALVIAIAFMSILEHVNFSLLNYYGTHAPISNVLSLESAHILIIVCSIFGVVVSWKGYAPLRKQTKY